MIPRQASICAQIRGFTIFQVESKLVPFFSSNLAMKYALRIPHTQANIPTPNRLETTAFFLADILNFHTRRTGTSKHAISNVALSTTIVVELICMVSATFGWRHCALMIAMRSHIRISLGAHISTGGRTLAGYQRKLSTCRILIAIWVPGSPFPASLCRKRRIEKRISRKVIGATTTMRYWTLNQLRICLAVRSYRCSAKPALSVPYMINPVYAIYVIRAGIITQSSHHSFFSICNRE